MRNKLNLFLLVIIITLSSTFLLACGNVTPTPDSGGDMTEYVVTFDSDGGSTVSVQTVKAGEKVSKPSDPTKIGYTFKGWFSDITNEIIFDFNTEINANITVYALWEQNVSSGELELVGFTREDGNNGTFNITVSKNTEIFSFSDITIVDENSTWLLCTDELGMNQLPFKATTLVTGDNILYIIVTTNMGDATLYKINVRRLTEFQVYFDADNGSEITAMNVEENSKLQSIDANKTGYDFVCWKHNGDEWNFENDIVVGEMTLVAFYNIKTFVVTFMYDGVVFETASVDYNTKVLKPLTDPTGDEVNFQYWEYNYNAFDFDTLIAGDLTLTAVMASYILNYSINSDGKYVITSIELNNESAVELPQTYKNIEVVGISAKAFYGCTNLTGIVIPKNITHIGLGAFAGCDSLESMELSFVGESLNGTSNVHFGYIFGGINESFNATVLPESLKSVTINHCESIGEFAFYKSNYIESITVGDTVKTIGKYAFSYCDSLVSATLSKQLEYIPEGLFMMNLYLNTVLMPESITEIGAWSFAFCYSISEVIVPENVTLIGTNAFYFGYSISNITILSESITIGAFAFAKCSTIESITLPEGVNSIQEWAFYGCEGLKEIYIPSSVTVLKYMVFDSCKDLTIYCDMESRPSGWDTSWNHPGHDVVWN